MLHKIIIENFFSIANAQEIDLTILGNAPDLPCFKAPLHNKDIRLPTVIGFFGANASGKTTILRALYSAIMFACKSFGQENVGMMFQPYKQKKWIDKPTKIIIEFDSLFDNFTYPIMCRYELHIAHNKQDPMIKNVEYEALFYTPKGKYRNLFERHQQNFNFGEEFNISNTKDDPRKTSIRPDFSVISTLSFLNHPLAQNINKQLSITQMSGFFRQDANTDFKRLLIFYFQNKNYLENLNMELRRLDIGLEKMQIEQGPDGLFAKFKHVSLDDFVFFHEESTGTQRFINIFPKLQLALDSGAMAIIDEIDTDLHPLLMPEILRWFSDPKRNPRNAQLLFTAHNPFLLDELEKEQVFFSEKLSGQSTQVFGAKNIKGLRREPSLMKKYVLGELGAVPHIG